MTFVSRLATALLLAMAGAAACAAPPSTAAPLQSLPRLAVAPYMGTWYQVLWLPNSFQKQCASDTAASYRELGDGTVEVVNRCRKADGEWDSVTGVARPPRGAARIEAGVLQPARLEVSFLPRWLRWTGIGWGAYWVVDLAADGRYAIVSEASREYLWVLSRQPALTPEDETLIRRRLETLGFELAKVQSHPHTAR
ncbi:MAG TPA: lipocalin family protein [Burkholderiaceae bacterium]|nr:lipocalin family protein [Burkholderiaceae bacterium]